MNRSTFGKCVSGAAMLVACCGLAQVAQAQIQWKATPGQTYVIPKQVNLKASLQGLGVEGHGVVQLTRPITDTGREFLGALGLEILSPVGNNAFICQVHGEPDYRGLELSGWITGVVNIDPNWKDFDVSKHPKSNRRKKSKAELQAIKLKRKQKVRK